MTTIGYLFIFIAAIIVRQVSKGRMPNITEDVTDTFVAITTGDAKKLKEVSARTGEALLTPDPAVVEGGTAGGVSGKGGNLVAEVKRLGAAAKGYGWGRTGPDYYDCSGLVWRACKNLGLYTGPRFTSATFGSVAGNLITAPNIPSPGDVVVWTGRHMGVVTGANKYYSARSRKSGILEGSISSFGRPPKYYTIRGT